MEIEEISNVLSSGSLSEVLELVCPECGRPLRIAFVQNFGGILAARCECRKFGIQQDGVAPPEWVIEARSQMPGNVEKGDVEVAEHKVVNGPQ